MSIFELLKPNNKLRLSFILVIPLLLPQRCGCSRLVSVPFRSRSKSVPDLTTAPSDSYSISSESQQQLQQQLSQQRQVQFSLNDDHDAYSNQSSSDECIGDSEFETDLNDPSNQSPFARLLLQAQERRFQNNRSRNETLTEIQTVQERNCSGSSSSNHINFSESESGYKLPNESILQNLQTRANRLKAVQENPSFSSGPVNMDEYRTIMKNDVKIDYLLNEARKLQKELNQLQNVDNSNTKSKGNLKKQKSKKKEQKGNILKQSQSTSSSSQNNKQELQSSQSKKGNNSNPKSTSTKARILHVQDTTKSSGSAGPLTYRSYSDDRIENLDNDDSTINSDTGCLTTALNNLKLSFKNGIINKQTSNLNTAPESESGNKFNSNNQLYIPTLIQKSGSNVASRLGISPRRSFSGGQKSNFNASNVNMRLLSSPRRESNHGYKKKNKQFISTEQG